MMQVGTLHGSSSLSQQGSAPPNARNSLNTNDQQNNSLAPTGEATPEGLQLDNLNKNPYLTGFVSGSLGIKTQTSRVVAARGVEPRKTRKRTK